MAWPLLCTYLRGEPRKLEPLTTSKNAPRHIDVCIANDCSKDLANSAAFPFCFLDRTIPN